MCMCVTERVRDRQAEEISKTIDIIFNDFRILPFYPPVDKHMTRNRVVDGSNRLCSQIKKKERYRNKYWTVRFKQNVTYVKAALVKVVMVVFVILREL